jgi:DtxR family Mn-dependent transcriptional regulator
MINPLLALTSAVLAFLIIGLLFWPARGYLARGRKARKNRSKILMEDALKYLFDCEQQGKVCTAKMLAKVLNITAVQNEQVVLRLSDLGLVRTEGDIVHLNEEGRAYALRIIRIHRLWERYLAEETGIPEQKWHVEAEIQEHRLTIEEANELSRQMGYPRYDPHGDPIPTRNGDLPTDMGRRLNEFSKGDVIRVLHIEDEPTDIYTEIISKGITLDSQLEILKKSEHTLHVLTNGIAYSLSFNQAANISGVLSGAKREVEEKYPPLSTLKSGEKGEVIRISRFCRGSQRRRLMDLGIVPGTEISMELASASGDPKAYKIRGAVIALRKEQADLIDIKPLKKAV